MDPANAYASKAAYAQLGVAGPSYAGDANGEAPKLIATATQEAEFLAQRLAALENRLGQVVGRLFGPREVAGPENASNGPPQAPGMLGTLGSRYQLINMVINKLESHADQLGQL